MRVRDGIWRCTPRPPLLPRLRGLWSLALGATILSVLLYLPTVEHSYFADDHVYLGFGSSKLITLAPGEMYRIFVERMNPWEFLPLRDLSYWVDIQLWGGFPDGFHFSNVLWYALSCLAAGGLASALMSWSGLPDHGDAHKVCTALTVALFAVHPAHVEPVAWIAGRKDLMAGTFMMLALALYLRGLQGNARASLLALSSLCVVLALLSKGAAVGVVLVFPFLAAGTFVAGERANRVRMAAYALMPLLVAGGVAAFHAGVGLETGIRIENALPPLEFLERAARIWSTLAGIVFAPIEPSLIYEVYGEGQAFWLVATASLVASIWAVIALIRGSKSLSAAGVLLLVFSSVPYLQVVPFSTWSMASERFVFVGVLGAALIGVDLVRRALPSNAGMASASVALAGLLLTGLWMTSDRVSDWEWPNTLAERQYQATPHYFNGVRLYLAHTFPATISYDEAEAAVAKIDRADAKPLMTHWIRVRQALPSLRSGGMKGVDESGVCADVLALQQEIEREFRKIRVEKDLAYNNLLRTLERDLELNFPNLLTRCR